VGQPVGDVVGVDVQYAGQCPGQPAGPGPADASHNKAKLPPKKFARVVAQETSSGTPLHDCVVGKSVGINVGLAVGDVVGDAVGDRDGDVVGDCVGVIVGNCVGLVVGDVVGDCVGVIVGNCVGLVVGDIVGAFVGAENSAMSDIASAILFAYCDVVSGAVQTIKKLLVILAYVC
jgi:hypothetical protein